MKIIKKIHSKLSKNPYLILFPYSIISIILLLFKDYIFNYFCVIFRISLDAELYKTLNLCFTFILFCFCFYKTYIAFIGAHYYKYTRRNYIRDRQKYNQTYRDLLEYFKDAEPLKLDTSIFPEQSWKDDNTNGIIFGKLDKKLISLSSDTECNIVVFGPPGSGKTSGVAIPLAMKFGLDNPDGGSVLAVDIKGDIYNYVSTHSNRKILRFAPDIPDAIELSARYNPFANIENMNTTDKKLYIENMATTLIPNESGESGNYFSSRARKIFQGVVHYMLFHNPNTSFPDVIHAILQGNVFDWVNAAIDENNKCIEARELLSSFWGNSEKNVTSAYDCLTTSLLIFSNPILDKLLSSDSDNCISIEKMEEGYDVYLQISQEHLNSYAPLFTMIIQSFSSEFSKRSDNSSGVKNKPILMLLDEFPAQTHTYSTISSNLSTLRSKNIKIVIICQNLSQIEYRYNSTGARSLLGNCNYWVILGSNDINSGKLFSDMFGVRKILKISTSETSSKKSNCSRSIVETTEKVFTPESFGDLKNELVIYYKGKYIKATKINCYKN